MDAVTLGKALSGIASIEPALRIVLNRNRRESGPAARPGAAHGARDADHESRGVLSARDHRAAAARGAHGQSVRQDRSALRHRRPGDRDTLPALEVLLAPESHNRRNLWKTALTLYDQARVSWTGGNGGGGARVGRRRRRRGDGRSSPSASHSRSLDFDDTADLVADVGWAARVPGAADRRRTSSPSGSRTIYRGWRRRGEARLRGGR